MRKRSLMLVAAGALAGAVVTGVVTTVVAQNRKPYVRLETPRIKAIEPKDFTAAQREAVGPTGTGNENIRTALYEPEMGKRWWSWLTFVWNAENRAGAALPFYEKELVILRVNFLCHDDWVWVRHVPIAKRYGRSDADIARIPRGLKAGGWSEKDAALLAAVDELHTDYFISDATWNRLTKHFNTPQMLDLIFTVGNYHLNAMYTNSVGMPMGEGYGRMPKAE